MGFKSNKPLLLVAFTILSCSLSESRGIDFSKAPIIDVNSLLNNPEVQKGVLSLIFQNQGTSLDQVHDKIIASVGNLQDAVVGINSELKANVFVVDGDLVKVDPENLKMILKNAIQTTVQSGFSQNPALASTLQNVFNKQIDAQSPQLADLFGKHGVPVNIAQQVLNLENSNRRKRDVAIQPRDFDLGSIVTGVVGNVLQGQLGAFISQILGSVKAFLSGLYVAVAPANPIESIISSFTNSLVQLGIQWLTAIEEALTSIIGEVLVPASRKRRDSGNDSGEGNSGEGDSEDGDFLGELVGPIFVTIGVIIQPIVAVIQNLFIGVWNTVLPIVGGLLIIQIISVIINFVI